MGIISLSKQYGTDRVEKACTRALAFRAISYKNVKLILKNNLDSAEIPDPTPARPPLQHENIRGAAYYADDGCDQTNFSGTAECDQADRKAEPQLFLDIERS